MDKKINKAEAFILFAFVLLGISFVTDLSLNMRANSQISYKQNNIHEKLSQLNDLSLIINKQMQVENPYINSSDIINENLFNTKFIQELRQIIQKINESNIVKIDQNIREIRAELNSLYKTLDERNFRQRHIVADIQKDVRERSSLAILGADNNLLTDLSTKLDYLWAETSKSPMRQEYKIRVREHLDRITPHLKQDSSKKFGQLSKAEHLLNAKEVTFAQKESLLSELQVLTSSQTENSQRAINKSRYLIVLMFAGLALFSYTFMKFKMGRFIGLWSLRKHFENTHRKQSQVKTLHKVLKANNVQPMALVDENGKIRWSSAAFKRIFQSGFERKLGWDTLSSKYLISSEQDTNIENCYRLKNASDSDFVVNTETIQHLGKSYQFICLQEVRSYFRELRQGPIQSQDIQITSPNHDLCLINQEIEDLLLENTQLFSKLNLKLEYKDKLPRFFNGGIDFIRVPTQTILTALVQAGSILDKSSSIGLNYTKNNDLLCLKFRLYGLKLSNNAVVEPLPTKGPYLNFWEAFHTLEKRFEAHSCQVNLKNITTQPNADHPYSCFVEIEVKLSEKKTVKTQDTLLLRSSIREQRTISV